MNFVYVSTPKVIPTSKQQFSVSGFNSMTNPFAELGNIQSTTTTIENVNYDIYSANIVKHVLISIIDGLNQKNFGHDTLNATINNIRQYRQLNPDVNLYIDSGGYSIIVGDVDPVDIPRFIYYYNYYLENERDLFEYMFSLDIPIFLGRDQYNTKQYIYNFNKSSLTESRKLLEKYPELRDKFYFIYQFKVDGQYQIWRQLYKELELKKYIKRWGIGGMVGLRGILRNCPTTQDINFSPFTALAFRSFFDYLNSDHFGEEFRLHNLGVYIRYDRFQLIILEKLFKRYLEDKCEINLTYDSINYLRTAQLKVKTLEVFEYINEDIHIHPDIQSVPANTFKTIYDPCHLKEIYDEQSRLINNQKLNNIDSFVPLNIKSNLSLDRLFEKLITEYNMIDAFFEVGSFDQFKYKINPILSHFQISYPTIFTPKLIKCILENLRITYIFNYWYINNRTETKLDDLVFDFISKINFPAKLL